MFIRDKNYINTKFSDETIESIQNDELAHAASSLMEFIEENGVDFSQIEVNDLVRAIKSKYKNRSKRKI